MKWIWLNRTQVAFGRGVVKENMARWVKPGSKVICTYGGGSIEKNGAKQDVFDALAALNCDITWMGGIPPNPEYEVVMGIASAVRMHHPDLLLAVGGGSVLDGTKFASLAAELPEGTDAFDEIIIQKHFPPKCTPVASVMTLPATGSEWDNAFVISWRARKLKNSTGTPLAYPLFSMLDPTYTATLPLRQLANGIWDAMVHCVDSFLTPCPNSLMDDYWTDIMKELLRIGPEIVKEGQTYEKTIEYRERLIMAASFAENTFFELGKDGDWGIHKVGHQLTAKYGMDHAATLAITLPAFFAVKKNDRKELMAKAGEKVFGAPREATQDEKADFFVTEIMKFAKSLGMPEKISEYKYSKVEVKKGDIEDVTKMVMDSMGNKPYGWGGRITEDDTRAILKLILN